jgi:Ca2+:H+ antiporter
MCCAYLLYLYFLLFTNKEIFESHAGEKGESKDIEKQQASSSESEPPEVPHFSAGLAVFALAVTTILISFESEFVVDSLEPAAYSWGLSQAFIGVVLLPIVGNAAEHATAVTMAAHNKMDICIGVAVGSSLQIALLVVPLLVVISWATGCTLNLNFQPFNVIMMFVSVVVVNMLMYDGKSHWLEGVLLLLMYIMIALSYLHTIDPTI